jgi:hypothetical protein
MDNDVERERGREGRGAMYDESLQAIVGSCIQARWTSVWFMSITKITPVRFITGKFFFNALLWR